MPLSWYGCENPRSVCNSEPGRNGLETTPQLGDESNFEALRLESGFRAKTKDSGNDQRETRRSDWKMHLLSSATPETPKPVPVPPAKAPADEGRGAAKATPRWQKYGTPILVVLLALAVLFTITHNWNAWEGGHVKQVTDDAYVRGDLTPLSTKVAGIVRNVNVSDYQQVHKRDLLVELEDNDYQAQVAQASAGVEAARAAIENNRRQRALQDAQIQKALAGIDQATAQIAAAQAGKDAVDASLVHARSERKRQEGLYRLIRQRSRIWRRRLLTNRTLPANMPAARRTWPRPPPHCAAVS